MKKVTLIMIALVWSSLSFAGDAPQMDKKVETPNYDITYFQDSNTCQYWGASSEVGDSLVAEATELGLGLVEVGFDTFACTLETVAYLGFNGVVKPVVGTLGKSITWLLETLTGLEVTPGKRIEKTPGGLGDR